MPRVKAFIHLLQGRSLAVKDRGSSDPFVRIYANATDGADDYIWQSRSKSQTLDPKWNDKFTHILEGSLAEQLIQGGTIHLICRVMDDDGMHGEDAMGTTLLPIKLGSSCEWYKVEKGEGEFACANATGEIQIKLEVTIDQE